MKKGYTLHFRRRREGKTDYHKRLKLIKSKTDRLVVRITNTRIICHIVRYNIKDKTEKTIAYADSRELAKKYTWKYSLTNIPSAYLTGMIIAKHAKKEKINNAILDIGEKNSTKGAKVFAVLKGAVDGGLNIPHEDKKIPDTKRLSGGHIAKYRKNSIDKDFEKLKTTINK